MHSIISFINPVWKGTLRAYPQILFSDNIFLGIVLLLVSFIDVNAGLAGLIVALVANFSAMSFGLDSIKIEKGLYAFNAVLAGLGIGMLYEQSLTLIIILIFAGLLCLALTVMSEGITAKYGLPFLSLPFLLTIWILILAIRGFSEIQLSERSVYYYNYLYSLWGNDLVKFYDYTQNLPIAKSLLTYFSSLGAIFFQSSVIAGIVIAVGLFFASRISFLFSVAGFYAGWLFFQMAGGDIASLSYSYVGFNFILTAIAIGGFFVVPTWRNLLLVIVITPVNVIFTQAMVQLFGVWQLPVYSLPFIFIVLTFLYILKYRVRFHSLLPEVAVQEFSPEKNLYSYKNFIKRFGRSSVTFPLRLPFWGEWTVEQGQDSTITHTDEYRFAWDFTIHDNENKTFKKPGTSADDFYCYKKAVLATGYGRVVKITDGIADNEIGSANMVDNWGNTIIIKHSEYLYSKLSHLNSGSFKVYEGDYVYPGQILAQVGNSGRSPEPHLHMQLQASPWLAASTIKYPLSHYMVSKNKLYELKNFDYPREGDVVFHPEANKLLTKILDLIPGQKMAFEYNVGNVTKKALWTVYTDSANKSYIYCEKTKSQAWFGFDKTMLYFHHFSGNRKSLLYYYFLAFYKVQAGFYKSAEVDDEINLSYAYSRYQLFLNDITATFFSWMTAKYKMKYLESDDEVSPTRICLKSEVKLNAAKFNIKTIAFSIVIEDNLIKEFEITDGRKHINAKQLN